VRTALVITAHVAITLAATVAMIGVGTYLILRGADL
jgi:hypothetical protein